MGYKRGTPEERFKRHYILDLKTGCWNWTACLNHAGYGVFKYDGQMKGAHRFSYKLYIGEIEDDLLVCHRCDNPKCVNPFHFFKGTDADNMKDGRDKGRMRVSKCPSFQMYAKGCRCEHCVEMKNRKERERHSIRKAKKLLVSSL